MLNRVIEIAEDGRYLSVERGFLKVSTKTEELGRVPLNDIAALIVTAHDTVLSKNVMLALAERGGCTILCGDNFHPAAMVTPFEGHHQQTARIQAQAQASKPLQKQIWKTLIAAKIRAQSDVLRHLRPLVSDDISGRLDRLSREVTSGDPENREAQAARLY